MYDAPLPNPTYQRIDIDKFGFNIENIENLKYFQRWMEDITESFNSYQLGKTYKKDLELYANDKKIMDIIGCFPQNIEPTFSLNHVLKDYIHIDIKSDYTTMKPKLSQLLVDDLEKYYERYGNV